MLNYQRYKRNPVLHYPEREWPDKQIEKAPIWCSVDLRDGNQALMEFADKLEKATVQTIEAGKMTKDLVLLTTLTDVTELTSEGFIKAIRENLEAMM